MLSAVPPSLRAATTEHLILLSPANGARFAAGETIRVSAEASFLNARNAIVEFFANDQSLGMSSGNPATFDWTNVGIGEYCIVAEAILGARRLRTAVVTIHVVQLEPRLFGGATAVTSFASDSLGNVQGWGLNDFGQLGTGVAGPTPSPQPVLFPAGVTSWKSIAIGRDFTLFLSPEGQLYACGLNQFGVLGNGTADLDPHPVLAPVPRPADVERWMAIAAGSYHAVAIDGRGRVFAWGGNQYGALGQDNPNEEPLLLPTPVHLPSTVRFSAVTAGYSHTLALAENGQIYSWGYCDAGQLGRGTLENDSKPGLVTLPPGTTKWTAIAAGYQRSMALADDGQIYSWGNNSFGQLGTGTFEAIAATTPVASVTPSGAGGWIWFASGAEHVFALARNGVLYAWGRNDGGQLADNSPVTVRPWGVTVPQAVPLPAGTTRWVLATAGNSHSLLLADDCRVYSCGLNVYGELGTEQTGDFGPLAPISALDLCQP